MAQQRVAKLIAHITAGNDPYRSDKAQSEAKRLPWSRFPASGQASSTDFRSVTYEVCGGICTITRNRPHVLNAVNFQVHCDMIAAFEEAESDDKVLVVILTGEGRYFCSGADVAGNPETYSIPDPTRVTEIKAVLAKQDQYDSNTWSDVSMYDAWINFSKPLVIAVNGPAIGEGFTTLMMGDIIYSSDSAFFWAPFARFGVVPEITSTVKLAERVGPAAGIDLSGDPSLKLKALRMFKGMLKDEQWRARMLAQNRSEQEMGRQRLDASDTAASSSPDGFHLYTLYLHPECYEPEVFGIKEKELRSKVFGYEALNNTERANLWKAMRSSGRLQKADKEGADATAEYSNASIGGVAKIPVIPVPKSLAVPMLPFQKEGLSWMVQQEESEVRGGILADEMGMGKTIQAISLLLAKPAKGPCLVVCPMAAVNQWVKEIEKFTQKGTLKTLIYHGADKRSLAAEFKRHDVVVTTYQTLEVDYRRETNKQRLGCKYCGKLFMPEKLVFHQKYFCGPGAERTAKQQKTGKKDLDAAKKSMITMGIGQKESSGSGYSPPTITNIYKDYMKQAGNDVKANGFWNVQKENRERAQGASSSSSASSSKSAPK
ncbi:unnamed protein product, partial [Polarella glacialis]